MAWSVYIDPLVSLWLVWVLAAAAVAALAVGLLARARGAIIRSFATAALLLGLLNPVVQEEEREQLSDIAVVVTDHSLSQSLSQRLERTDAARAELEKQLESIENLEVRWVTANRSATSSNGETRLFSGLFTALADVPPDRFAGTILLTDGQVHDVPENLSDSGYNGPVHALLTGKRDERDRRIVLEQAPRYGIVGESRTVKFRVEDDQVTGNVDVQIAIDGKNTQTLSVPVGQTVDYELNIDHGGHTVTELSVAVAENELTPHNNRAVFTTDGVRERLRVLLVSGEPHPGERTWRNLLKADAAVDLVHFTILRPPEKQDGTPIRELSLIAFPTSELFSVKLNEFDLIIFDRYQRRGVLPLIYLSNIASYVEQGGAVLIAAGPAFATPLSLFRTPLGDILPSKPTGQVTLQPYRPLVTDQGARHPVTRALPGGELEVPTWGRWFRLIDVERTEGNVLMAGPGQKPLVILNRRGEGRVAQLLSDHTWLWARGYEGGGPQAELLRRMAHWLMQEPELEEEALTASFDGRKLIVERRSLADEIDPVTITSPSGKTTEVELSATSPGVWQARVDADEVGLHRLDDGKLSSVAAVGNANTRELQDVRTTDAILRPISELTGGGMFWMTDQSGAFELPRVRMVSAGRRMAGTSWLGLKSNDAYVVKSLRSVPLFTSLLGLAAILFLLGFTWFREGR